ncbi:MAG: GTP-binding protein [Erysipelotrichaceae bacterium]|nr:GTP-binding protein [Erysipelotrichaceae bacterium]
MTKVTVISGFLGAGKTTLIQKLLKEAFTDEQVVLIENEFGEIGIDGGFMQDAGIAVKEMNSGCICCSLVGDFENSLKQVLEQFTPDRILIEPSGVGKLSDIVKAIKQVMNDVPLQLDGAITVVDAKKVKMHQRNFGEFFNDQLKEAQAIILSHTQMLKDEQLKSAVELIREWNPDARIMTTNWDQLSGKEIMEMLDDTTDWVKQLNVEKECDHECECEHEHHHHHHEHDHECGCEHEHHHEHDHECDCGHEHHHHHHGHDADEIFETWGLETPIAMDRNWLEQLLHELAYTQSFGQIVRAKGIVETTDGKWVHFDVIADEVKIREGSASYMSRLCVIGVHLNVQRLQEEFGNEGK